jgi:DNA-binding XRE family transcriptional regulator
MGGDSQDSQNSQMDDTHEFQRHASETQTADAEPEERASEPSQSTRPEPSSPPRAEPSSPPRPEPSSPKPRVVKSEPSSSEPAPVVPRERGATGRKPRAGSRSGIEPNNVRKLRQEAMMSKAELARRAGVSPLTIDRVEAGCPCRMDTKRKILEALGLKPSARAEVWPDIDAQS